MQGLVTARPLTTRLAVHVLAVDPDRRILLDADGSVSPMEWGMPSRLLDVGEDPSVVARRLVLDAGSVPATRAEVIDLESRVDADTHVVHLVFECGAEPYRAGDGRSLWWSLEEIVGLRLGQRTRKALASRWSMIWPDT
jgi:hypothetical protein